MSTLISNEISNITKGCQRVCLPYGLDFLDLVRWFNLQGDKDVNFTLVIGEQKHDWRGSDAVDLFNEIRSRCEHYILADTFVSSKESGAIYFFDRHERFSFFSGPQDFIDQLFPFTREIMWEHFALAQEEDDDRSLRDIFDSVHSA